MAIKYKRHEEIEPGRGYSQEDLDAVSDNPPLTDDEMKAARPFKEVFPEIAEKMEKVVRGRPKADVTKTPVTIRLDADVVDAYKMSGKGWQSRINTDLRCKVFIHPMFTNESGQFVDLDVVVLRDMTIEEAVAQHFGTEVSYSGALHQLLASVHRVENGNVEKRMVYRKGS